MSSRSWFSRALLPWYRENQRPLPWRKTPDPYRVWLSEVILQQTRVDQGTAYWHRFVEHYPSVAHLAQAPEQQVLKLWQGLGYYSRARNLRTAAQQVVKEHDGRFPADHAGLLTLKGVGDYTASAIASICFGQPEPVVDGNVYRVLARVFGIATPIDSTEGKKQFRALAGELISEAHPGDHNQAVMELGATVCTPKNPRCDECPLARKCIALKEERIAELPVKAKRAAVRERHFNYLWIETDCGVLFRQRGPGDIWQGLWELPLIETANTATASTLKKHAGLASVKRIEGPVVHVLSHQRISATLWQAEWDGSPLPKDWKPVTPKALKKLPMHRLVERLLGEQV